MAKKNNAIYSPGELSRVRENLGVTDDAEAKRMAQLLGGEVGTERYSSEDESSKKKGGRRDFDDTGSKRSRRIDLPPEEELAGWFKPKRSEQYAGDDPSIPARLKYGERVKIDQYAGQVTFEIKNSMQVLTSIFSFFREPVDFVNPRFVLVRMNEYYNKVERLVNAARNLFPENNKKRNNQLKRTSLVVYKILDTLRNWNIEAIGRDISELQAHPRSAKVTDFSDVLREIYKPIFILDELSTDNIKSALKLIYKILYIESPMEAKEKYQDVIRNIIASLSDVRRNVNYGLYPLLMKLISDRFIVYERFFIERRKRFIAFLNIRETEQLDAADLNPQQIENIDVDAIQQKLSEEDETTDENTETQEEGQAEDVTDPKVIKQKAKEDAEKVEYKAMEQGKTAMEVLFPKAGWDKLEEYPDFYPYFANMYTLKHGYELIAPRDPLQYVSVLLHILDDLCIGLRYIKFSTITGSDGAFINVSEELTSILNNWRSNMEDSFSRDYLPRLSEYCRMLENSIDSRSSPYAKKILNELHWIKRLCFLPYYRFESMGPPPFPKNDIISIYNDIRKFRKYLTAFALGIEQSVQAGGAAAKAPCKGINNPWEPYNFPIPNPVSRRLDVMLAPEKRMNATLVFFSLSAVTVLDYIVNNENSWVYNDRPGPLFRSVKDEGVTPLFGVDKKIDADKLFRESLKKTST
jgi:hypothetical protein